MGIVPDLFFYNTTLQSTTPTLNQILKTSHVFSTTNSSSQHHSPKQRTHSTHSQSSSPHHQPNNLTPHQSKVVRTTVTMSADAAPAPLSKVDSAVQGLSSSPPKEKRRASSSVPGV